MGRDLHDTFPMARSMYEKANNVLEFDIAHLSFEGPAEVLVQTVNTQPAIFVHSAIAFDLASQRGLTGDVMAGHSLGEYSALYAAGVLSFEDALTAVRRRAQFMQEACEANPSTMAAVLGLDWEQVTDVCKRASERGVVVAANYNGVAQIVISGDHAGIAAATELAKEAGAKRVIPLAVGGAFHSPLMEPSPARLQEVLDTLEFHDAHTPVILNVTARPTSDAREIKRRLIDQLTAPVLWYPTMREMEQMSVTRTIEIGPKKVLTGLAKSGLKDVSLLSVDTITDLETLEAEFARSTT